VEEIVQRHITMGVSDNSDIDTKDLIIKITSVREFLPEAQVGPDFLKALDTRVKAMLAEANLRRIGNRRQRLMVYDL
jgi:hypothetical protein